MSKLATAKATADTPRTKTTTDPGFEQDLLAAGMEPAKPEAAPEAAGRAENAPETPTPATIPEPVADAPQSAILPNARIAAAIVKAQAGFKTAIKDADNPYFKSKYATLADCWDAVKDALHANGLAVLQPTVTDKDGKLCVATTLLHESGESMGSLYPVVCAKANDPQAMGSAITYARRYALSSMLGIIADVDDDAEAATIHTTPPAQQPPAQPKRPMAAPSQDEIENAIMSLEMAECRADVKRIWEQHKPRLGSVPAFIQAVKAAGAKFPEDKELK